jgi:hypothetical protein
MYVYLTFRTTTLEAQERQSMFLKLGIEERHKERTDETERKILEKQTKVLVSEEHFKM